MPLSMYQEEVSCAFDGGQRFEFSDIPKTFNMILPYFPHDSGDVTSRTSSLTHEPHDVDNKYKNVLATIPV